MAIIINTKKVGIPVQIGELEFTVDTSDNGLDSLLKNYKEVAEEVSNTDGDNAEVAKELLTKGFDLFLGEGSFEAVYKQTPSIVACSEYLQALVEGIVEELGKLNASNSSAKVEKYLKDKKKK